MASLSYHVDQAVREENRRAIAGEPPLAESDPLLEGFFTLTLEEIGITPEMLAEARAKNGLHPLV